MFSALYAILTHILLLSANSQINLYIDPESSCEVPQPYTPECPFKSIALALEATGVFQNETKKSISLFLKEGSFFNILSIDMESTQIDHLEICAYSVSEKTCKEYKKMGAQDPILLFMEDTYFVLFNCFFRVLNIQLKFDKPYLTQGISLFKIKNASVTIHSTLFEKLEFESSWENNISIFNLIDCNISIKNCNFSHSIFKNLTIFSVTSTLRSDIFLQSYELQIFKEFEPFLVFEFSGNTLSNNSFESCTIFEVYLFPGGIYMDSNAFLDNKRNSYRSLMLDIIDLKVLVFKNNILREFVTEGKNISVLVQIFSVQSAWLVNTTFEALNSSFEKNCIFSEFFFDTILNLIWENTNFINMYSLKSFENIDEILIISDVFKIVDGPSCFSGKPLLTVIGYFSLKIIDFNIYEVNTAQSLFEIRDISDNYYTRSLKSLTVLNRLYNYKTTGDISLKVFRGNNIIINDCTFRLTSVCTNLFNLVVSISNLSITNCTVDSFDFHFDNYFPRRNLINIDGVSFDHNEFSCLSNLIINNIIVILDDNIDIKYHTYLFNIPSTCIVENIFINGFEINNFQGGTGMISVLCSNTCPNLIRIVDSKLSNIDADLSRTEYLGYNFIYIECKNISSTEAASNVVELQNIQIIYQYYMNSDIIQIIYPTVNILEIVMKYSMINANGSLFNLKANKIAIRRNKIKLVPQFTDFQIFIITTAGNYFQATSININDCEFSLPLCEVDSKITIFRINSLESKNVTITINNVTLSSKDVDIANNCTYKNHFLWIEDDGDQSRENTIIIKKCQFINLVCVEGCVFFCPLGGNILVSESSFTNIIARGRGAVVLNNKCRFKFENSLFQNNVARLGDFVYLSGEIASLLELKNNTFIYDYEIMNQFPIYSSGLFLLHNQNRFVQNCSYYDNTGLLHKNLTVICDSQKIKLSSRISKEDNFDLDLHENQFVKNWTTAKLNLGNQLKSKSKKAYFDVLFAEKTCEVFLNSRAQTADSNTLIISNFEQELIIFGYSNEYDIYWNNKLIYGTYYFLFTTNINVCDRSTHLNINECIPCNSGSYSLSGLTNCLPCPLYATCNDSLVPKENYWRSNPFTDRIYFCYSNPGVCTGNDKNPCIMGYRGPLCQSCNMAEGYGLIQNKRCEKCENLAYGAILFTLMFFCFLFLEMYLLYTEIRNINDFSRNTSERAYETIKEPSIFLDSFITHVQLLSLIQSFNFEYPKELKVFSNFFVDTSSQYVYSQYCFLHYIYDGVYLVFLNFGTIVGCSLLRLLFLYLIWLHLLVHKFKKSKKSQILTVFVTWGKIEFVTIIREWFLLRCEHVDGEYYIKKDSNVICTLDYRSNFISIIFPVLSAIIVFIPIPLYIFLGKFRNKLRDHKFIKRFGSLYFGTRPGAFYWNAVTFYIRVFFIMFMIYTQSDSIQIFGLYTLLLLYGLVSYILRPYRKKAQNYLNEWGVRVYLLTISFALIKSVDSISGVMGYVIDSMFSPEVIDLLLKISIYLINFCFLIILAIRILIQYSERLNRLYKSLKIRYYSYRHMRAEKKKHRNFNPKSSEIIVNSLMLTSDDQNQNERNPNLFFSTQGDVGAREDASRNIKSRVSYPIVKSFATRRKKQNKSTSNSFEKYQNQDPYINVSDLSD